jgi:hypothetical protein
MPEANADYELYSLDGDIVDGRFSVLVLPSGDYHVSIEEWGVGQPDAVNAEVIEAIYIFSPEEWRSFLAWARKTAS